MKTQQKHNNKKRLYQQDPQNELLVDVEHTQCNTLNALPTGTRFPTQRATYTFSDKPKFMQECTNSFGLYPATVLSDKNAIDRCNCRIVSMLSTGRPFPSSLLLLLLLLFCTEVLPLPATVADAKDTVLLSGG